LALPASFGPVAKSNSADSSSGCRHLDRLTKLFDVFAEIARGKRDEIRDSTA
jgi:hypothetical protein